MKLFRKEKQRAYLAALSRDHEDQLRWLIERNQLLENQLRNRLDHVHSLEKKLSEQHHEQIALSHRKERLNQTLREKQSEEESVKQKIDQQQKRSDREIDLILQTYNQNEHLNEDILRKQQQMIHLASRNKRRMQECLLLNEKIRLYQAMNDQCEKQEQQASRMIQHLSHRILNIEHENDQMRNKLRIAQRQTLKTTLTHQFEVKRKEQMHRINQALLDRPVVIRDSPMRLHYQAALETYPTLVYRLARTIEESVRWREKILWIDHLYFVSDRCYC